MSDTAARWRVEHRNFERLLKFLEGELGAFADGEKPNYQLMLDVVHYLAHFPRRYHVPREHAAFAFLLECDGQAQTAINRLREEHFELTAKGTELGALLFIAAAGGSANRGKLQSALAALATSYRDHIAEEENEILPRALDLLSEAQWAQVAHAAPSGPDPFRSFGSRRHDPTFGSEGEARYLGLAERIAIRRQSWPVRYPVRADERGEARANPASIPVAAAPEVSARHVAAVGSAATPRQSLVWHTTKLAALVLAYLQFYFLDIQLQIARLPSLIFSMLR